MKEIDKPFYLDECDTYLYLNRLSRNDLRAFAKCIGVPRGQNKQDTLNNLENALDDKGNRRILIQVKSATVILR